MNVIYRTKADFRIGVDDRTRQMNAKMVSWCTASVQGAFDRRRQPSLLADRSRYGHGILSGPGVSTGIL